MKRTSEPSDSSWVHPFEKAGLGKAPFRCVGYAKMVYQACPEAPIQPGASCDFCSTAIMHTYTIRGVDSARPDFKVGCDCLERTGDTELVEQMRREERAYERKIRETARKEWLASDEGQKNIAEWDGRRRGHDFRNAEYAYDRKQADARSNHVGTIGERRTFTLTINAQIPLESAYGTKYLHIMTDDEGNKFVWFASGSLIANPAWRDFDKRGEDYVQVDQFCRKGDRVVVKATIKSHGERDGMKQTMLTRVK